MEHLREFRIEVYMDTNKKTTRKKFDLNDYGEISYLIKALRTLLDNIETEGVLEAVYNGD